MAIDPVCGMHVDVETAAAIFDYKGKTYYFCAPGCKAAFQKDPEKFLHDQMHHGTGASHGCHCH